MGHLERASRSGMNSYECMREELVVGVGGRKGVLF